MTRRGFHILLAAVLAICAVCPYIEVAINWTQSIFDTGYDTESTVAVIALLLILAFALASLLVTFAAGIAGKEWLAAPIVRLRSALDFILTVPEVSPPPLPLRI
jgi:hypothetical protein